MKSERDTRKAMRARFNQMKTRVNAMVPFLALDPEQVAGTQIADMRDDVNDLTQCLHEFSAYWNVLNT